MVHVLLVQSAAMRVPLYTDRRAHSNAAAHRREPLSSLSTNTASLFNGWSASSTVTTTSSSLLLEAFDGACDALVLVSLRLRRSCRVGAFANVVFPAFGELHLWSSASADNVGCACTPARLACAFSQGGGFSQGGDVSMSLAPGCLLSLGLMVCSDRAAIVWQACCIRMSWWTSRVRVRLCP